jgi:hypothetical protein
MYGSYSGSFSTVRTTGFISGNRRALQFSEAAICLALALRIGSTACGPNLAVVLPQRKLLGDRWRQLPLPGSSIALQNLFLRDVVHPLDLAVPHLNDTDLLTLGDTDRNLLTSGRTLF